MYRDIATLTTILTSQRIKYQILSAHILQYIYVYIYFNDNNVQFETISILQSCYIHRDIFK